MLTLLTRKFCPLMTMALMTVACGKKIGENNSEPGRTTENQERPAAYVLQLDTTQGFTKLYQMPQNGRFKIPTELRVRQGNALSKVVEVRYNANPDDSFSYDMKCTYKGISSNRMSLTKCIDYDDDDLGNISEHLFPLYEEQYIELRITGSSSEGLVVDSIHDVTWL